MWRLPISFLNAVLLNNSALLINYTSILNHVPTTESSSKTNTLLKACDCLYKTYNISNASLKSRQDGSIHNNIKIFHKFQHFQVRNSENTASLSLAGMYRYSKLKLSQKWSCLPMTPFFVLLTLQVYRGQKGTWLRGWGHWSSHVVDPRQQTYGR